MRSPKYGRAWVVALMLVVSSPLLARAECIEVPLPKGARLPNPLRRATLAFIGKATATGIEEFGVSFQVERVWVGDLPREATLFVIPSMEGFTTARTFQPGTTYIVILNTPVIPLDAEDLRESALPAETIGVQFGCGAPLLLADASKDLLKRLGPGRLPRR